MTIPYVTLRDLAAAIELYEKAFDASVSQYERAWRKHYAC
ncbi:MAG: putative glyoxalase superfamily protein PhnB [Granulosicoccus sp.]|jgi:uncharacterized glyoxalase superfamily protein PhnB